MVNGKDIQDGALAPLNLSVSTGMGTILASVRNIFGSISEVQLRLSHDGAFPFKLTLSVTLDKKNTGYFANLFYFNGAALEFMQAGKFDKAGKVSLSFNHASDYLIVVSEASMEPAPWQSPFTDIKSSNWFYENVRYAYENSLMTGTSDTIFAPNIELSRAMLVTILYR